MLATKSGVRPALMRAVSYALIGLLCLGADAGWVAAAAASPQTTGGVLSIVSDPTGADVFVDGIYVGKTPLNLDKLTPGDHQLRVARDGYLEKRRTVTVGAQGRNSINVTLTPQAGATGSQPPPAPKGTPAKKGSSKKWIFIGAGVVAAGVGVVLLLPGKKPPVPGTISVSPNGTGMAGITNYTFSSQGSSDPNGDGLTYAWTFGDGSTGSGQSASHTFAAGTYTVQLSVTNKKSSVSAPSASVTVGNSMAGTWSGGREPFLNASVSYNLTQTGTTLSGSMTFSGNLTGTVTGVTGSVNQTVYPATVTLTSPGFGITGYISTFTLTFTGPTNSSGTSMTGTMTMYGSNLITQPAPITTTFTR